MPNTTQALKNSHLRRLLRLAGWLCVILAVICIPLGIMFHLQNRRFEFQQEWVLSRIATVELGHTTREQALILFADLKQIPADDYYCEVNSDCTVFAASVHTSEPSYPSFFSAIPRMPEAVYNIAYALTGEHVWKFLWDIFHVLGLQPQSMTLALQFQDGRVGKWDYERKVARGDRESVGEALTLTIHSVPKIDWEERFASFAEHDEYRGFLVHNRYSNTGNMSRQIFFSPDATPELRRDIFRIDTHCLHTLHGCESAMELISDAEADEARILKEGKDRLASNDPCPTRIIRLYTSKAGNIHLIEVGSVEHEAQPYTGTITLRSQHALKGNANVPNDVPGQQPDTYPYGEIFGYISTPDQVSTLVRPGARFLLFDYKTYRPMAYPCSRLPATPENLKIVTDTLAAR